MQDVIVALVLYRGQLPTNVEVGTLGASGQVQKLQDKFASFRINSGAQGPCIRVPEYIQEELLDLCEGGVHGFYKGLRGGSSFLLPRGGILFEGP